MGSVQVQSGEATITYQAGTSEGTATVTATSQGLTDGSANITLTSGATVLKTTIKMLQGF